MLCLAHYEADDCVCATEALAVEIGPEDLDLCDAIGLAFIAHSEAGAGYIDAWDAASEDVAAARNISGLTSCTNATRSAHAAAIAACQNG